MRELSIVVIFLNQHLKFEIYADRAHAYRWRAIAKNGNIVANSGESFASKRNAKRAVERFILNVQMEQL